jgi:hypothetical protein
LRASSPIKTNEKPCGLVILPFCLDPIWQPRGPTSQREPRTLHTPRVNILNISYTSDTRQTTHLPFGTFGTSFPLFRPRTRWPPRCISVVWLVLRASDPL